MDEKKIIVITGPTASGKTNICTTICDNLNCEIITADSMQIYKGFDVGTAKPDRDEQKKYKHHLIDIINPDDDYSVSKYVFDADKCIDSIFSKNKIPIVSGGTGLYIKSMLYQHSFASNKDCFFDSEKSIVIRKELQDDLDKYGKDVFYNRLLGIDKIAAQKLHMNDTKRVMRALEIFYTTGKTKTELTKLDGQKRYSFKLIVVDVDRDLLYKNINDRVDNMVDRGLLEEVKSLIKYKDCKSMQAIGYKELVNFIEKKCTFKQAIEDIKQATRNYAKRQLTFFRAFKDAIWLPKQDIINYILQDK